MRLLNLRKSRRMLSQHKFERFTSLCSWYGIADHCLTYISQIQIHWIQFQGIV